MWGWLGLVPTLVPPFGTPRAGSGVFPSHIGSLILVLCLAPGSQFPLASWPWAPAVGSSFWCYVRWLWPLGAALAPSLWSSPAAVGCSLPCFYKKLLFRVDLLDFFCRYDPSLRCLSLGLAGSSISGAGGRWIHCFLFFSFRCSNLQSPIKAKNKKYHLGKIGCGRQPPPDDYRVLPLFMHLFQLCSCSHIPF